MYKCLCALMDNTLSTILHRWTPLQPQLAAIMVNELQPMKQQDDSWLKGSILWNTPTHRRTLEKRRTRRFGSKIWGTLKGPQINKRIRVDHKTGEYFELGKLAPQTYSKVMEETRKIQKKMAETFGAGVPKDEDVFVVYKGESKNAPANTRIVEMEAERPSFFSQNLMQKEYGKISSPQETVKPSGLG